MSIAPQGIPNIIWTLWLQGWERAPEVAKACLQSWKTHNPNWTIQALDRSDVLDLFVDGQISPAIHREDIPPEAVSDVIRIALLRKYGGVWVDSTVFCLRPLDEWLHAKLPSGFFAFARPGPDRMLSTWFLAAHAPHELVEDWYRRTSVYWEGRDSRDCYFWFHKLFAEGYDADAAFRAAWDSTPEVSACGPYHFGPHAPTLLNPISAEDRHMVDTASYPVLKLTHKLGTTVFPDNSFLHYVCAQARAKAVIG